MMTKKEAKIFYAAKGYQARLKRIPAKDKSGFLEKKLRISAHRQVELLKKYFKKSVLLCDIGASKGYFLFAAKPYVKDVVAIEPGEEEAAELRAKNIKRYPLLEAVPASTRFDTVSMFHMFEHINEPFSYLKELKRHLAPGARVFVEVPNADDALAGRYHCEPFRKFYFQSMHCFYYNEASLTKVFKESGFTKIKCLYIQRYPFANHLQWLLRGKPGGNAEYENKFKKINSAYADILQAERITDTLVCIFTKTK